MRIVAANELQDWLSQGEVLEKDSNGPKVVRLLDGAILKIFRSRHPLRAQIRPEARRFTDNAEHLQRLGIRTPIITDCYWIDRRHAVSACLYKPLPGISLERLFLDGPETFVTLIPKLSGYIRKLHQSGIYFRSLHLGNILLTPDGDFGLIDFLDIRFKGRPLKSTQIKRNFKHLQNYLQRRKIQSFPWSELLEEYERAP